MMAYVPADDAPAEQAAIRDAVDTFAKRFLTAEYLDQCDREARYPREAMDALAAGGWSALPVPEEFGGAGASITALTTFHEALARHSLVVAQAYFSLWVLGADVLTRLGTPKQQEVWLPRINGGTGLIAFALTEPESGSDAAALRTSATRIDDGFRVSGQKVFITGAAVSDVIVTAVRTGDTKSKHAGISLLLIDPHREGVTIRPLSKLGIKALDLCEVYFDDVQVDREDVLGSEDHGWSELQPGLARERIFLAAIAAGGLRDIVERTLDYAKSRHSFGKPIGNHQLIAAKLVHMHIALQAATELIARAARLIESDHPDAPMAASVAKLFTTDAYVSAAREGIQVHGGYGYTDDYPLARHYRDAKYLEIGGGTSEIQTIVIARGLGLRP
jgi:alkylation response protein AidB-like acyl-CoA dehydrogenase